MLAEPTIIKFRGHHRLKIKGTARGPGDGAAQTGRTAMMPTLLSQFPNGCRADNRNLVWPATCLCRDQHFAERLDFSHSLRETGFSWLLTAALRPQWRFSPHGPPPDLHSPQPVYRMIDWGPLLQAGHAKKISVQHSHQLISTKIASSHALHGSDQAQSLGAIWKGTCPFMFFGS
jgi:hypothetical protein